MQVPFQVVDGGITSIGKHGFSEAVRGRRRSWVCGATAINVSMILVPFDCSALPNNLTRPVRFPLIWEPGFPARKHNRQTVCHGIERKRGMGPRAACDAVGHTQVTPFEEVQQGFVIHFQILVSEKATWTR